MGAQFIMQGAGAGLGIPVTVATPKFPNVPNLPGVPQIARSLLFPPSAPPTAGTNATSGALWHSTQAGPTWGVFDSSNAAVLKPDSVQDFGWRQEYKVSNYPVQNGQFASFNKVRVPFESSIIASKGGTLPERVAFLQQVDKIVASLSLYTIITPEKSYLNCNVTRAELMRRGSANANYFDVELFFIEISQVSAQYSTTTPGTPSTADSSVASAVPPVNQGLTNAPAPSSSVQSAAVATLAPVAPTS